MLIYFGCPGVTSDKEQVQFCCCNAEWCNFVVVIIIIIIIKSERHDNVIV